MSKCAFDSDKKCAALTEKKCNGCRFRKTSEEVEAGREKACRMLKALPLHQRRHLIRKYHARDKEYEAYER